MDSIRPFILGCIIFVSLVVTPVGADDSTVSDTELHVSAGAIAALSATSLVLVVQRDDVDVSTLALVAGISSLSAGFAKELLDFLGYGTPEWRDIFNTLVGGALGLGMVVFSQGFPDNRVNEGAGLPFTYLSVTAVLSTGIVLSLLGEGKR